jgi:hypothetical protein
MRRIFYFSGHRLTVFHWSRKALVGACSFEPDDEGHEKFRQYLVTSAKTPTSILLDVIEEDFRKDVIPHVYGKDRKAVINRLIDRYYRSSRQYTYTEIQGREKSGRKDDEVLLAAITNPELVRPWIRIIEECDVPLSGILSLPLISKSILPAIGVKKGPVLLVSQQVNSNLRQTFFKDGKMVSSRQSVINQDAENISNIGIYAKPEIQRTLTFIRNQHQMEDSDVINVHILGSDSQIDSLNSVFVADQSNQYHVHRVKDISQKLGIKGLPDRFADGLFAWVASNNYKTTSHYGRREEFSRFYYSIASTALYVASVAAIIISLLVTEANISDGMALKKSSALLQDRNNEFMRVYVDKYQAHEELFSNAGLMDAAVGLVNTIERNSQVTPLDFMLTLSDLLSNPLIGRIYIDKIEWTTRQADEVRDRNSSKLDDSKAAYRDTDVTSAAEVQHVAIVTGRIPVATNSYRDSVNHINNIISILRSNEYVTEVSAINLPVEVRPEKKFAAEDRPLADDKEASESNEGGMFSLRVIMRAHDHV